MGKLSPAAKESLSNYRNEHDRCCVCYRKEKGTGHPLDRLEIHHIVGRGRGEHHDERNLVLVCQECHRSIDSVSTGRSLELGHILTAKEEEDGSVDLVFLAGLRNRVALKQDPMRLPAWVDDERKDRGHGWWR